MCRGHSAFRASRGKTGSTMMDMIYLSVVVGFFALCAVYLSFCDRG